MKSWKNWKSFDDPTMPDVDEVGLTLGLMRKNKEDPLFIGEHEVSGAGLCGEWNFVNPATGTADVPPTTDDTATGEMRYELNLTVHFKFTRKLDADYKAEIKAVTDAKFGGKVWYFMSQDGQTRYQLTMQPEGLGWTRLILKRAMRTADGRIVSVEDEDDDPSRNYTHLYFLLETCKSD